MPVRNVDGQPAADAQELLEQDGFVVTIGPPAFDDVVPRGSVISTNPPGGTSAPRESEIVLIVSDGPTPVKVPDVANKTYDEAAAALTAVGFKVGRNDVFDDKIDVGKVVGTDPGATRTRRRTRRSPST